MSTAQMNLPSEPRQANPRSIVMAHGGGGQLTDQLLADTVFPRLNNPVLGQLLDSAILAKTNQRVAMSIDSYVVSPWRFPGGDIGRLAVCGTVNDLAVCGARPSAIALSVILTEGFPIADFEQVMDSIAQTAREAEVQIVTGDTKVVERGQGDGVYITTAGVGFVPDDRRLGPHRLEPGDVLLINGPIGEHGLAVMLAREMPEVESVLVSDAAPLNGLIEQILNATGDDAVFMRDPTRSGVAGVVADLAQQSGRHIVIDEPATPIRREALHAADMLGFDPLEVANEGKVIAVVRPEAADAALRAMRAHPLGREAAVIGRVMDQQDGLCELLTHIGGRRVLQKPYGEQLPRIC